MSASKTPTIVTDGNAKVNTVIVLGETKHVAARLSHTINHLSEFVYEELHDSIEKKVILKTNQAY